MRIGLYGMPAAGKTRILDQLDFIEGIAGSRMLREYDPDFEKKDEEGRKSDRRALAERMRSKTDFVMDGHYAFGDELAFTPEDGGLYDVFIYLYIDPAVIGKRMQASEKNRKYLRFDIAEWQNREMRGLRQYCHEHNKDFYIADDPPGNCFGDVSPIIDFIRDVVGGFSSLNFAKRCARDVLDSTDSSEIILADGEQT